MTISWGFFSYFFHLLSCFSVHSTKSLFLCWLLIDGSTPGSHIYLSCGYPLPSSIIKQTRHLFFFLHLIFKLLSKSMVKGEGCCEYGMGHGGGGLVPCSPLGLPLILLPLGLCPADRSSLLSTRSLLLSLYCIPLYSAITSPSSESSDICWRFWSPVAPMLVFISSRGRRGRLWVL